MRNRRERLITEIAHRVAEHILTEELIEPIENELGAMHYIHSNGNGYEGSAVYLPRYLDRVAKDHSATDLLDSLRWLLTHSTEPVTKSNIAEVIQILRSALQAVDSIPNSIKVRASNYKTQVPKTYAGVGTSGNVKNGLNPGYYPLGGTSSPPEKFHMRRNEKLDYEMPTED